MNFALNKLETTVPAATIIEMIPAKCIGVFKLSYIVGQAAPSKESGKPKLINARKITINRSLLFILRDF